MSFVLNTPEFTGPIEALLQLIEKRKLPINDISLSLVTDEYMRYINTISSDTRIANRIHFIYVASTLALIKSKSLLPKLDLSSEEESDIEELKKRLERYRFFQKRGQELKEYIGKNPSFYLAQERKQQKGFYPHESMTPQVLSESLNAIYRSIPKVESKKQEGYIKIAVHIEELMDSLIDRVKNMQKIDFNSFLGAKQEGYQHTKERKVVAVVSFLALLEVVRNHGMNVQQDQLFSNIELYQ